MHDVDRALVVGCALAVAAEIAKISTGREDGCDARDFGDLVSVLEAFESLDHQDQYHVVIDRVPIAAWDIAPHCCVESLTAAIATPSQRREVRPVARFDGFFNGIHCRHDDNERSGIERMLNLALIRVAHTHAWNSF